MNIVACGKNQQTTELKDKLSNFNITVFNKDEQNIDLLKNADVVFDLNFDEDTVLLKDYILLDKSKIIIVGSTLLQLENAFAQIGKKPTCHIAGMVTLNGMIGRNVLEITEHAKEFESTLNQLGWTEIEFIKSRVGMATPRVICMIINEAFYTVQEGTASKKDIDKGMKLGTNYPQGPFDWCNKLGIDMVYKTLDAMYKDTQEERYRICPLLKTEYLQSLV